MREVKSDEARRGFRDILDEMERDPAAAVKVLRYDRPVAVVVSAEWYRAVTNYIEDGLRGMAAAEFWDFLAASMQEGRRVAGLAPQDPRVVHHLDGDPANNDAANLRVTEAQ